MKASLQLSQLCAQDGIMSSNDPGTVARRQTGKPSSRSKLISLKAPWDTHIESPASDRLNPAQKGKICNKILMNSKQSKKSGKVPADLHLNIY